MRIVFVGAGAMGGSFGGHLARTGCDVTLIDVWEAHVAAIASEGLRLQGVLGQHQVELPAMTAAPEDLEADLVVVFTDANATAEAAATAARILRPDGCAVTFQNGVGNVETLVDVLGEDRVLGGSSMCSAMVAGPGNVVLTHLGPTSLGELDGSDSERARTLAAALRAAGFEAEVHPDIVAKIWHKFLINASINALCATSGLRLGEMVRLAEMSELQDRVLDEALAVVEAKGIALLDPDIRQSIKRHCRLKFSRPSMMQHVEAGRRTEIDAINGAVVREGRALGIPTPYNTALVALLKGRERSQIQHHHEPPVDYAALEREVRAAEGG